MEDNYQNDMNLKMQHQPLEKIIQLAKNNHEIEVLWLYGSRARGCATEQSDYDLAVAFESFIDDPIKRRLRPELLSLEWNKMIAVDISIVDFNLASLPLAYSIVKDNSPIVVKNQYRLMTEEQKIMSRWELDHLYHKKHYA